MAWKLNKIEMVKYARADGSDVQPGDWWYCPWYLSHGKDISEFYTGADYMANWFGKRDPVTIVLPGGTNWFLDGKSRDGTGWVITGPEGLWTASPSILVHNYHGWLRDGVLSDDTDGRKY